MVETETTKITIQIGIQPLLLPSCLVAEIGYHNLFRIFVFFSQKKVPRSLSIIRIYFTDETLAWIISTSQCTCVWFQMLIEYFGIQLCTFSIHEHNFACITQYLKHSFFGWVLQFFIRTHNCNLQIILSKQ